MEKAVSTSPLSSIDASEHDKEKPTMENTPRDELFDVSYSEDTSGGATTSDDVRVVRLDEYKQAALALAEAFAEDDVAMYFIDTPDREHWTKEQKWNLHVEILEYVTYAHLLKGLVLTAGENYGCIALWCV